MTGPVEREWDGLARRYAVVCREIAVIGCGVFGMVLVPGPRRVQACLALLLLILWSAAYGWLIMHTTSPVPVLVDIAVLCVQVPAESWTVPHASILDGSGWIFALVSLVAVTYQWHTSVALGSFASFALVVCYVLTTANRTGDQNQAWLGIALWVIAESVLSRGVYVLIRRSARISDGYLADREQARARIEVSRVSRLDELTYLADLHDTAAATFLMIGVGAVPGRQPWLAEQARRDLRVLRAAGGHTLVATPPVSRPPDAVDLGALITVLTGELARQRTDAVQVELLPDPLPSVRLPPAAAEALRDSAREALLNVARHAGTGTAVIRIEPGVVVEIRDQGRGFDPDQVPAHRRGIAESITARMRRVGGRALVSSAPGQGTVVRLEWLDE